MNQYENRQRHRESNVRIGSRHDFQIFDADKVREPERQPIHRNQIHKIHQENPDDNGQARAAR